MDGRVVVVRVWDIGYSWLQITNNSELLATCFGQSLPKHCEIWRNLPVLAKSIYMLLAILATSACSEFRLATGFG